MGWGLLCSCWFWSHLTSHRLVSAPHPSPLLLLISPLQWATLATQHSSVISRRAAATISLMNEGQPKGWVTGQVAVSAIGGCSLKTDAGRRLCNFGARRTQKLVQGGLRGAGGRHPAAKIKAVRFPSPTFLRV